MVLILEGCFGLGLGVDLHSVLTFICIWFWLWFVFGFGFDLYLVLVLIYEAEALVAYLGVFADDLHFSTGVEHVGWLSCMWVNPIMRGKGIAKRLISTVFEAWSYKIFLIRRVCF